VKEYVATDPVAPVLPHAPQVSQLVESSTLSITVLLGVLGVGEGVGVGVGDGLGLAEVVGVGEGVGDGFAASDGLVALLATMLPPQPVTMLIVIKAKAKLSNAATEWLQRKGVPRGIWPGEAA
jgi:hypothetical protein